MSCQNIVAIILHFRTEEKTLACLHSLQAENICRTVIIDNSEDSGYSISHIYPDIGELKKNGLCIDVVTPEHNLGFATGINYAMEYIRNQYGRTRILLINSDAFLGTGSLAMLNQALDSGYQIAIPHQIKTGLDTTSNPSYYHRLTGLLLSHNCPGTIAYPSGCCMLLSDALNEQKIFDEDFFFYGEDVAFGYKLNNNDIKLAVVKEAHIQHHTSSSAQHGSFFYEYHIVRSHWLLTKKITTSSAQRYFAIIGRLIYLPIRAFWRTIKLRSLLPIKGFLTASYDILFGRLRRLTPPCSHDAELTPPKHQ